MTREEKENRLYHNEMHMYAWLLKHMAKPKDKTVVNKLSISSLKLKKV